MGRLDDARGQLTAFLTSLFKAVESTPNAALVYTLAIGKDGRATDAYSAENQFVADRMAEIESVSARKATLLNPTEEDETVQVLRRRLFEHVDDARAAAVVDAYRELWIGHQDALAGDAARPETVDQFRASYPLHPHVLETLTGKTATLANFQRVRGMLRLLARTVAHLWRQRPADATAIHLHHIDPGFEPIRQEIVTRLGQAAFVPAVTNDVAAGRAEQRALAEAIDAEQHQGLPPYAAYVARTIFMHTLAFNDPLKGLTAEELRYAAAGPAVDPSFIDEARKRFTAESAYLDDRPAVPMRFLAEANLSVIIRREEQYVDPADARAQLNDRIRDIFDGRTFDLVPFPGGPFDVPDEVGDGRPKLVVFAYDGLAVGEVVDEVPELVERVYARKRGRFGAEGPAQPRRLRRGGRARRRRHAAARAVASGAAAAEGARSSRRPGGASAGEDPRPGGAIGAGAGDRRPAVLPARVLPVAEPHRHARRGPGPHGGRHAFGVEPAGRGSAADRTGAAGSQEAALPRRRAGRPRLRA